MTSRLRRPAGRCDLSFRQQSNAVSEPATASRACADRGPGASDSLPECCQPKGHVQVVAARPGLEVDAGECFDPLDPVVERRAVDVQLLRGPGDVAAVVDSARAEIIRSGRSWATSFSAAGWISATVTSSGALTIRCQDPSESQLGCPRIAPARNACAVIRARWTATCSCASGTGGPLVRGFAGTVRGARSSRGERPAAGTARSMHDHSDPRVEILQTDQLTCRVCVQAGRQAG